jgi:hypothetical protein
MLDLLKTNLPGVSIELLSPKFPGANRLTLFLYKIIENPDLKNAGHPALTTTPNGKLIETRSPLTLDLYYLLTAHSGASSLLEAHTALSRAMRVIYDNGVLQGSLLRSDDPSKGLTADATLRVTLNPISMEDMTRIWSVFPDTPYEISVVYLVTPVPIESTRVQESAPVVDQYHEHGQREAELVAP